MLRLKEQKLVPEEDLILKHMEVHVDQQELVSVVDCNSELFWLNYESKKEKVVQYKDYMKIISIRISLINIRVIDN